MKQLVFLLGRTGHLIDLSLNVIYSRKSLFVKSCIFSQLNCKIVQTQTSIWMSRIKPPRGWLIYWTLIPNLCFKVVHNLLLLILLLLYQLIAIGCILKLLTRNLLHWFCHLILRLWISRFHQLSLLISVLKLLGLRDYARNTNCGNSLHGVPIHAACIDDKLGLFGSYAPIARTRTPMKRLLLDSNHRSEFSKVVVVTTHLNLLEMHFLLHIFWSLSSCHLILAHC